MKFEVKTVPFFNPSAPSIRDLIILSLSEEWPLTARQIHAKIRNQTPTAITYQGVHKAVKHLEENGMLSRKDNLYRVDMRWLREMRAFADIVQTKYARKVSAGASLDHASFTFDSMGEADEFLIDIFTALDLKPGGDLYMSWNHFWVPIFLKRSTYQKMTEFAQKFNCFDVCNADTPLDRWCIKRWAKYGIKEKFGVKIGTDASVLVCEDIVAQVYYPPELLKEMDKVYKKAHDVSEIDVDAFYEDIFEKKAKVPVIIAKDPALAEHFKVQIMKAYKTGKGV